MEFSIKSILELFGINYKHGHEISEYIFKLYEKLPGEAHKQIGNVLLVSVKWLGKLRNYVRYGFQIQKIPPEHLIFFNEQGAKQALYDAEILLKFLINVECFQRKPVRIGILNGYLFGPTNEQQLTLGKHNIYPSKDYHSFFDKIKNGSEKYYHIENISASKIGNQLDVIINPFGEVYPEIDLKELYIFDKILNFIQNGGIFVNLGGFAFWAARDTINKKSRKLIDKVNVPLFKLDKDKKIIKNNEDSSKRN